MDTRKGRKFEEENKKEEAFVIINGDGGKECDENQEEKEIGCSSIMDGTSKADDEGESSPKVNNKSPYILADKCEEEETQRSEIGISADENSESDWVMISHDVINGHPNGSSAFPPRVSTSNTAIFVDAMWKAIIELSREFDIIQELVSSSTDAITLKDGLCGAMAGVNGMENSLKKLGGGNTDGVFEMLDSVTAIKQGIKNAKTGCLSLYVKTPKLRQLMLRKLINSVLVRGEGIHRAVLEYLIDYLFTTYARIQMPHNSSSTNPDFKTGSDDSDMDA